MQAQCSVIVPSEATYRVRYMPSEALRQVICLSLLLSTLHPTLHLTPLVLPLVEPRTPRELEVVPLPICELVLPNPV